MGWDGMGNFPTLDDTTRQEGYHEGLKGTNKRTNEWVYDMYDMYEA